jgi:sulfur carrier protein
MQITVNGQPEIVEDRCTVRRLLERHGLDRSACAVEVNREVVPRRKHEERHLAEGDRIEIVTLVGGG